MVSLNSSWKNMTFDASHLVSSFFVFWARKDFTHLEQIPNAFFVWSELSDLSPTSKSMVLNDGDLFYGHTLF